MRRPVCIIGLAYVFIILIYMYLFPFSEPFIEGLDGSEAVLTGQVDKKEYRISYEKEVLIIYLKNVQIENPQLLNTELGVLCYMQEGQEAKLGSYVRISGKLKEFAYASNPGEFDARSYYEILGMQLRLQNGMILQASTGYSAFREKLFEIKRSCSKLLDKCYEEAEASLLKAMLLGEKNGMDEELKTLYQQNGIIHILSISGLHISLIGMGLYKLLKRLRIPLPVRVILSVAVMYCYGIMTGMSVSAVRAVFMFAAYLGAEMIGRTYDMLTALALAALLILIGQPLYIRHSGFLFSFGAILAIGLFLPEIEMNMFREGKIEKLISSGLAVTVVTFPIYLYYYYEYPLYSVFLNLLVIPGAAFLVSGGLLSLLLSFLFLPLGRVVALPVQFLFACYEGLCRLTLKLPGSTCTMGKPELWQIGLFVGILCLITGLGKRMTKLQFWQGILLAFLLIMLRLPEGLQITLIDVGQGDGIYLSEEGGMHILIDGGSSDKSNVGTYQIVPFLKSEGTDYLDAIVVTHPDSDHISGICEMLEETGTNGIPIGALYLPDVGDEGRNEEYHKLEKLAQDAGVPIGYLSAGETLRCGDVMLTCFHPEKDWKESEPNVYSTVLYLTYGNFTALFTGDLEGKGEELVQKRLSDMLPPEGVTLLKVAHHGSKNSTSADFLKAVNPRIALISSGRNNRYGHPHEELLKRLEDYGCFIYQTKESGAVTVRVQNGKVSVEEYLE